MKHFILTNEQRKYLGLSLIESHWEKIELNDCLTIYLDNQTIRKRIHSDGKSYIEDELEEKVDISRNLLLPKTNRGKPRKLTPSAIEYSNGKGMYYADHASSVTIANYTTQRTYFSHWFGNKSTLNLAWLEQWIAETTEADLKDLEKFKVAKRKHIAYKEGDFFRFKIGRRQWGYGRILMDIGNFRKSEEYQQKYYPWFRRILTQPLLIKIYHIVSESPDEPINKLSTLNAVPSQLIMDNRFYYGEYEIIGNKQLTMNELDMPISYASDNPDRVYLQYGLIVRQTTKRKFKKYLFTKPYTDSPYSINAIGFDIYVSQKPDLIKECIATNSNMPYWELYGRGDLRNPKFKDIKNELFQHFGLDTTSSYAELLEQEQKKQSSKGIFQYIKNLLN